MHRSWKAWVTGLGIFLSCLLAPLTAQAGFPAVSIAQAFGSSSIAVNASTSLTFTVTNGAGTIATAGTFTDTLPAGLVVATPNGLSGTCTGAPYSGVVTATAGSGTISLSGLTLPTSSSCSLAVNVKVNTLGTKSNFVSFSFTGGGGPATANAVLLVTAAPGSTGTSPPIPNHDSATPTPGIGQQPTTVDLAKGQGPTMTTCMMNAIKATAGFGNAVYLGQDIYGVASIDLKDGRYLAFYPLAASTDTSRTPGIYFTGTNRANIATTCGSFEIAPAVFNLAALGQLVKAQFPAGESANIQSDGIATYASSSTLYALRPDFFVQRGQSGGPNLVQSGDNFSFNDGAGSVQALKPAFVDPEGLRVALASFATPGVLVITGDGTATYTRGYDGRVLVIVASAVLPAAPAAMGQALGMYEGNQRGFESYLYRGNLFVKPQRILVR